MRYIVSTFANVSDERITRIITTYQPVGKIDTQPKITSKFTDCINLGSAVSAFMRGRESRILQGMTCDSRPLSLHQPGEQPLVVEETPPGSRSTAQRDEPLRASPAAAIAPGILEVADELVSRPAGFRRQPLVERCVELSPLLKQRTHAAFLMSTSKPRERIRLASFSAARSGFGGRR